MNTGAFFMIVMGLFVVAGVLLHRRALRLRAEAAALAELHGFRHDMDPKPPPEQPFDLFERGRSRRVSAQIWREGGTGSVFRYQYTTGSGKNSTTHHVSCAMVQLPFVAPHTRIGPEGFWSGIGQALGIRDIEVESPTFNDRYRVRSDDERFAVTLLDGRAIDWFLNDTGVGAVRLELWGRWLLCITRPLAMERAFGFHDWALEIPSHLPDVLRSLYPVPHP